MEWHDDGHPKHISSSHLSQNAGKNHRVTRHRPTKATCGNGKVPEITESTEISVTQFRLLSLIFSAKNRCYD